MSSDVLRALARDQAAIRDKLLDTLFASMPPGGGMSTFGSDSVEGAIKELADRATDLAAELSRLAEVGD